MKTKINLKLVTAAAVVLPVHALTLGADPVIHVQWDGGGTPVAPQDYIIDTTVTGTPSFPDVKLFSGHLDWRAGGMAHPWQACQGRGHA